MISKRYRLQCYLNSQMRTNKTDLSMAVFSGVVLKTLVIPNRKLQTVITAAVNVIAITDAQSRLTERRRKRKRYSIIMQCTAEYVLL